MTSTLDWLQGERGSMYEWLNPNTGKENLVVVVSDNSRSMDNLISILFMSTFRGNAKDVVHIRLDKKDYAVHCDLVTYTHRSYLARKVGKVSEDTMDKINLRIARSLGLETDGIYKDVYDDLVTRIIND